MNNYISFYIENDKPVAKIHKNGKSCIIRNKNNIKVLMDICEKYGYKITDECTIKNNILLIAHDYEKYAEIKRRNKIQIVGEIKPDMKVSKKNALIGKVLVGTTLTILLSSIAVNTIKNNNNNNSNTTTNIINNNSIQYEIKNENEEINNDTKLINGQNLVFETTENVSPQKNSYELKEGEDIVEQINNNTSTINIIGDAESNQANKEIEEKQELSAMFTPIEFHYECSDQIDQNAWDRVKEYDDIFEKYANDYGIDKGLLEARAAQETNGRHYENLDGGPAIGILQIERANLGYFEDGTPKYIEAYNFNTDQIDRVYLNEENARDLETNIQIGAMFSQDALKRNNYNILVGTQEYNMGCGNMDTIMSTCSDIENIDENDLRNNIDNQKWLEYRSFLGVGDPHYIEHNFRYLPNGYTIKVRRVDNKEYEELTVYNDYQKEKEY